MERKITQAIVGGYFAKLNSSMELDVAIVGGGPSGLIAGIRLAQAGKNVAIFERKLAPGGGIWGGAMLFNDVVFQPELAGMLDEFGIRTQEVEDGLLLIDQLLWESKGAHRQRSGVYLSLLLENLRAAQAH